MRYSGYLNLRVSEDLEFGFARKVSTISHAPLLAFPAFAIINFFSLGFTDFLFYTLICFIFGTFLPVTLVVVWGRFIQTELDIPDQRDRVRPLIIVICVYLIGATVLYTLSAPLLTTLLMFCYFSNTLIVFFINFYSKISIHSMGVAGPTTALIYALGPIGGLLGLLIPVVMWSRVQLKRHNYFQVISGAFLGFILTGGQIQLGFQLTDIYSDLSPLLWIIYAIIGPALVLTATGYLNRKGLHDGYTRKIFHFVGFISIFFFMRYAPTMVTAIFIFSGIIYVLLACLSGNGFLWFDGIGRNADVPNEVLYVLLPMVSTVLGLLIGSIFFEKYLVEIGVLCVAIGDAVAEPVGVTFGRHKYRVVSLAKSTTQRSVEGSLSILIVCSLIIFGALGNLLLAMSVGLLVTLIEAVSPRGMDNFTVLVGTSAALAIAGLI